MDRYTVTEDYKEEATDGSGPRLIFKAGAVISWETAYQLGMVNTKKPPKVEEAPKTGKTEKL